ncbi:MAG TPA: hypothetical protein VIU61_19060 [Kofleriaceae bacterium]
MIIAIAFVIGCGGGSKPAVQEPKPAPETVQKPPAPTCVAVADHAATLVPPDTGPESEIKATVDAIKTRCDADQWSAEARECFGTAENETDFQGCTKLLTEAQMTAVTKDVEATSPSKQPAPAAAAPPKVEEPVRRSRGGTPKKQVPKSSDPCMGGE